MTELLAVDTPAPDFTLPDGEGNPVQLSDLRGRNVVLAFYPADRSPVCTSQLSLYQEMIDNIRGYDAELLAISVDSQTSHRSWGEEQNLSFPLLSDSSPKGETARTYGVYREQDGITDRALYFIDKQGTIREAWVGEHPGISPELNIVFDALERLAGDRERGTAHESSALDADDWSQGPADAAVTLLEYGDLECSDCGRAQPEIRAVLAQHNGQIRYIWRHFPLTTSHPRAMAAAVAAEAAGAQDRFWEMVDLLLTHQRRLEDDDLRRYAQQLGLDTERFERDMSSSSLQDAVKHDVRRGIADGVNATPAIFIDGLRYDGPTKRASLGEAVEAALRS